MSTPYRPRQRSAVSANYSTDINEFVSFFLKTAQNRNEKVISETAIGAMIISAMVNFVIGQGLEAQASPESSMLGWTDEQRSRFISQAEAFFRMNAGSVDIDFYGKNNFQDLQAIAFRNALTSGDVLLHRLYKGRKQAFAPCIQVLSGKWVRNPSGAQDTKAITGGVEFNAEGREIAYWIAQTNEDRTDSYTSRRYAKFSGTGFKEFDLIGLGMREANQVRGIPLLTPVIEDILDLEQFKSSYRMKAATQALFTAVIESEADAPVSAVSTVDTIKGLGRQVPEALPASGDEDIRLGTGNVLALNPGEKMNMVESKIPATDYSTYVKAELSHIGGAVGLAYEMMLQQYSSNYSASRATIAGQEKIFGNLREEFSAKFCAPVWEQVIDYGIRVGAIEAPGYIGAPRYIRNAVLASTWIGPAPITIDPVKEINAHILAIDKGLETRERAIRELYQADFEETVERIRKENQMMSELLDEGNEFNETSPAQDEEENTDNE